MKLFSYPFQPSPWNLVFSALLLYFLGFVLFLVIRGEIIEVTFENHEMTIPAYSTRMHERTALLIAICMPFITSYLLWEKTLIRQQLALWRYLMLALFFMLLNFCFWYILFLYTYEIPSVEEADKAIKNGTYRVD